MFSRDEKVVVSFEGFAQVKHLADVLQMVFAGEGDASQLVQGFDFWLCEQFAEEWGNLSPSEAMGLTRSEYVAVRMIESFRKG